MGTEHNTQIEVEDYDLTIELMKYWGLIKKWWWLILLSGLLCGTAALITSFFMSSVYEATTNIGYATTR